MKIFKKLIAAAAFALCSFLVFSEPQIRIKASQEQYFEDAEQTGLGALSNGIYPVRLTVTINSNDKTLYIKVYRSLSANGPFELVIDTMQGNEEYFDLYDKESMQIGKKYYYQAVLGRTDLNSAAPEQTSNISLGWGALTHEAFYIYFNTIISKSYSKMTLMNKPKALSKLGTEETKGNKSGTFLYNAKVKGMGGLATMSYNNYSDDGIVYFTGDMITNADILASGTMDGFVIMTGMYNGTVYFSDIIVKESKAAGGTYGVEPKGSTRKDISYTWNFQTLEE